MSTDIFSVIITQQDRALFLQELERVKKSLFSAQFRGKPDVSTLSLQDRTQNYWSEFVADPAFSIATLEQLRLKLLAAPVIRLNLAFDPDTEFLNRLADVFHRKTGNSAILEYEVEPHVCAGIIYSIQGKIVDLSLKTQLETFDLRSIVDAHLPFLSTTS